MPKSVLSIVTPVYNESKNLPILYEQLCKLAVDLDRRFEIIFVDDGSTDNSVNVIGTILSLSKQTPGCDVRLIELSRNFGKEIATTAGIQAATGAAVILLDSDLQHPIDSIPQFIEHWEAGAEVVVGVRTVHGHSSPFKKLGSEVFYKIMNQISDTKVVPHSTDFRLIDRAVVDAFNNLTEHQRMTRGLIDWLGFRREYVSFEAGQRLHGLPSYSNKQLIKLALNSFTSYSMAPLRLAGYLGVIFMFVFGMLGVFTYIEVFVLDDPLSLNISGTALLAILMLFSIGIVLVCLGIIALYIENIHSEVSNRPLYVVRRTVDNRG